MLSPQKELLPLRPRTRAAAKTARINKPILANVYAAVGFTMHVSAFLPCSALLPGGAQARAGVAGAQHGRAVIERFGCAGRHVIPGTAMPSVGLAAAQARVAAANLTSLRQLP
jgi:hypothetical protein